MDCVEYRRCCYTEGEAQSAEAFEHREQCSGCSRFAGELQRFAKLLEKAAMVDVPEGLEARVKLRQSFVRPRRRVYAMAAGVLAIIAGSLLFIVRGASDAALGEAVLAHYAEPHVVLSPSVSTIAQQLVIARLGGKLDGGLGLVLFADLCKVRGHFVGHFVIRVDGVEVTLLVLPDEEIDAPRAVVAGAYTMRLIPAGKGSLGVVAPTTVAVDGVLQQFRSRVSWRA